ncbi:hypothetical protein KAZ57_03265 [Patescibacteria group bacterium]|nr:hypothetical protein [Patescibacteria group bacterium]
MELINFILFRVLLLFAVATVVVLFLYWRELRRNAVLLGQLEDIRSEAVPVEDVKTSPGYYKAKIDRHNYPTYAFNTPTAVALEIVKDLHPLAIFGAKGLVIVTLMYLEKDEVCIGVQSINHGYVLVLAVSEFLKHARMGSLKEYVYTNGTYIDSTEKSTKRFEKYLAGMKNYARGHIEKRI